MIGVDEWTNAGLQLYPNPTSGELTLNYDTKPSNVRVEVLNVLGQIVLDETLTDIENASIYIPGESGVYTIRIYDSFGIHSHKIIKQGKE